MPPVKMRVWEQGNAAFGRLTLPMRGGGELSILVTLTHKQVLDTLRRAGVRFSQTELARIGSLFGGIGKFVKKVAKSGVVKGMLKVGKAITATGLLSVVPGVGPLMAAASGAAKLVNAAKGGGAKAVKAKLALKAATAQADLETQKGRQLPVPTSVREKGPEAEAAYRFLVTVKRVERAA